MVINGSRFNLGFIGRINKTRKVFERWGRIRQAQNNWATTTGDMWHSFHWWTKVPYIDKLFISSFMLVFKYEYIIIIYSLRSTSVPRPTNFCSHFVHAFQHIDFNEEISYFLVEFSQEWLGKSFFQLWCYSWIEI